MPWFLVDDDYHTHPATLAVSLAARGLWATAGSWCSKRQTDVVPSYVLASFGSTPELETELRVHGVWRRVKSGYRFEQPGLCKIPTREAVENARKSATERQARWRSGRRPRNAHVDASDRLHVDAVENSVSDRPPQTGRSAAHGRRPVDADVDASTRPSTLDPDPSPSKSLNGSVVIQSADRNARASPDLIELIITEVHERTGRHLSNEWAQRTYDTIIGDRAIANPAAYLREAIRKEPDPHTRFLPLY